MFPLKPPAGLSGPPSVLVVSSSLDRTPENLTFARLRFVLFATVEYFLSATRNDQSDVVILLSGTELSGIGND